MCRSKLSYKISNFEFRTLTEVVDVRVSDWWIY